MSVHEDVDRNFNGEVVRIGIHLNVRTNDNELLPLMQYNKGQLFDEALEDCSQTYLLTLRYFQGRVVEYFARLLQNGEKYIERSVVKMEQLESVSYADMFQYTCKIVSSSMGEGKGQWVSVTGRYSYGNISTLNVGQLNDVVHTISLFHVNRSFLRKRIIFYVHDRKICER